MSVTFSRLPFAAVLAALAAAAACVVLFAVEAAVGIIDRSVSVPSMIGMGPVSPITVALSAVTGSVLATIAFAIIGAIGRRPVRVFWIVSLVALVLSLTMPATVPGPPPAMRVGLALMHVVTWAICATLLTRLAAR